MPSRCPGCMLLLLATFMLAGCSLSGQTTDETHVTTGRIQVIGNEPFTRLALQSDDGTVYVLRCEKSVETMLAGEQGHLVQVEWKVMEKVPEGNAIRVLKAVVVSH